MTTTVLTERLAAACAAGCRWTRCTGTGSTHHDAHRCALAPTVELDPHPCTVCGEPARLYRAGWRCSNHAPSIPTPDPTLTMAALAARPWSHVTRSSRTYGRATTDPLGRDAWPINDRTGLPTRPKVKP